VAEGPFIPPRTREEIHSPALPGQRHEQALKIAVSLLGQGLSADAVAAQLRSMYDDDFSDHEIVKIVEWAGGKPLQPCTRGVVAVRRNIQKPVTPETAKRNADAFLNGWHCTLADLWRVSPWHPCEDWRRDPANLFAALYEPDDLINVVTNFILEQTKDGAQKACPSGGGITVSRDEWLKHFKNSQAPRSDAGAWVRFNPVLRRYGSGDNGSQTDADVAAYRFLLIESDHLPIGMQISLWSRLPMPVAALIDTGGRSVHAWLKVDCADEKDYRETVADFYRALARFGICRANKNPSRLSRLPGVTRKIGGVGAREQRLLYLNPEPAVDLAIFPETTS
jgi:hypothetical protein